MVEDSAVVSAGLIAGAILVNVTSVATGSSEMACGSSDAGSAVDPAFGAGSESPVVGLESCVDVPPLALFANIADGASPSESRQ
jgi:hypothetical protein